jgi:hypothetical protein
VTRCEVDVHLLERVADRVDAKQLLLPLQFLAPLTSSSIGQRIGVTLACGAPLPIIRSKMESWPLSRASCTDGGRADHLVEHGEQLAAFAKAVERADLDQHSSARLLTWRRSTRSQNSSRP